MHFFTGLNGLIGSHFSSLIGHTGSSSELHISSFVRSNSFVSSTIHRAQYLIICFFGTCESISSFLYIRSKPDLIVHIAQHRFTPNLIKISVSQLSRFSSCRHYCCFSKFSSCSSQYSYGETLLRDSGLILSHSPNNDLWELPDQNIHKLYERIQSGKIIVLPDNGSSKFRYLPKIFPFPCLLFLEVG